MRVMTPEAILRALETGSMKRFAEELSPAERSAVAVHIAGRAFTLQAAAVTPAQEGICRDGGGALVQPLDRPAWNGWGADITNNRFQSGKAAGISTATVGQLRLKWAFGFAGALSANAQPSVVGGRVFVGGGDQKVYALDAKTGCTHWAFPTDAVVRTAMSVGPRRGATGFAVYFGDVAAHAYALDAATGALLWKVKVEQHRAAQITGAPTLHNGVLYVPVSSIEEAFGTRSDYQCCTFRGSVVALNAETGEQLWKTTPSRTRHSRPKERHRRPALALRCGGLVVAHHRSGARGGLRRHWQRLFASCGGRLRRRDRARHANGPQALAAPTDPRGCLHRGLLDWPGAQLS